MTELGICMCPGVALQWHVASLYFFDAFLNFMSFLLFAIAIPYAEVEMFDATFDMAFDPPGYWLDVSIPWIGGLMRVTVIAGTL